MQYEFKYNIEYLDYNHSPELIKLRQYVLSPRPPLSEIATHRFDFPRLGRSLSFESGLTAAQKQLFKSAFAAIGLAVILAPTPTVLGIIWLLFSGFSLLVFWRLFLVSVALFARTISCREEPFSSASAPLPVYSILVPLYREAEIIPQIAKALAQLNWPKDRLDIQILLESDDAETIASAYQATFPENTRMIIIPPGGPRTKPNALNFGLSNAFGQYLTVYDAEDVPHPQQLRAAHAAFSRGSSQLACVQAPLIGRYDRGGWLASQWALEYSVQFGLLLPGLSLYKMPLLIGGTSNHFRGLM